MEAARKELKVYQHQSLVSEDTVTEAARKELKDCLSNDVSNHGCAQSPARSS